MLVAVYNLVAPYDMSTVTLLLVCVTTVSFTCLPCFQVKKTIDENVARAELLSKAARTGSIDVWKTVVEAVEGHRLLTKVHQLEEL